MKIRAFLDRHSVLVFLLPYLVLFCLFIVIPSIASVVLSFTDFNTIELPHFVGLKNYVTLLTNDTIFTRRRFRSPGHCQFFQVNIGSFQGYHFRNSEPGIKEEQN